MPSVRIDIPALVRFWNRRLSSQQKANNPNPIIYVKKLKEIREKVFRISNEEVEAIATFAHEIFKGKWDNYKSEFLAFCAILFLMDDNQLGRYVRGSSSPLCTAFNSVESTKKWIKESYDLETF